MKSILSLLPVAAFVLLAACGGPSQFAINTLYEAQVQVKMAEQEGATEEAPEAWQEAQQFLSQAETAFMDGKERDSLLLAHYARRRAEYARLLMQLRRLRRNLRIAEMDLATAQEKEQEALNAREAAERLLESLQKKAQ